MAHFPPIQPSRCCLILLWFALFIPIVFADGIGILGAGKWLYRPACAHACRRLIASNPLLCEGSSTSTHEHRNKRHSHGGPTPPECFLKDKAFLQTQALCMDQRCPRDNIPLSVLEEYWEGHLATGTVGDWSLQPVMSYSEALMQAQQEVESIGTENIPFVVSGEPLNQTSFIAEEDWVPSYNGQKSFDAGESEHGRNSLAICITSVLIPVAVSFLRYLPGFDSRLARYMSVILEQPAWGAHHRTPGFGSLGLVPTRGQALFIAYIIIINAFLNFFPFGLVQPNYIASDSDYQRSMIFGDRAGVLAEANFVALFLFSSRNNLLLWLTNWSHSTYVLLHRWIAYVAIFQICLHSVLMLFVYAKYQDYFVEAVQPYWYWGIIATLAAVFMWPAALLPIRRRVYQIFLAFHQVLAALVLISTFLHIWYLYQYKWGYELWVYIAGGIWGFDRFLRIIRIARNGAPTATITSLDSNGEYIRVDLDGIVSSGHVYVYFPTLSWRFWESHPFSVLSTFSSPTSLPRHNSEGPSDSSDVEKSGAYSGVTTQETESSPNSAITIRPRTTLLLRSQTGTTLRLAEKVLAAGGSLTINALIESSYLSHPGTVDLAKCSTLIGFAGGVGITAVLPVARSFAGARSRLFWGVRSRILVEALEHEIRSLDRRIQIETSIGQRMNIVELLTEEIYRTDEKGHLGVVVCGPAEMADEVRRTIGSLGRVHGTSRGVVFIDEAFSW